MKPGRMLDVLAVVGVILALVVVGAQVWLSRMSGG
jgi:hypothetical protein